MLLLVSIGFLTMSLLSKQAASNRAAICRGGTFSIIISTVGDGASVKLNFSPLSLNMYVIITLKNTIIEGHVCGL